MRPFKDLNTQELALEVDLRNIDKNVPLSKLKNKKDLEPLLKHHMKGIIRTPALCYGYEDMEMKELNLEEYEVSLFEGLHDLKGSICFRYYIIYFFVIVIKIPRKIRRIQLSEKYDRFIRLNLEGIYSIILICKNKFQVKIDFLGLIQLHITKLKLHNCFA